ncbi:MAG: hypothetical protein ACP5E9_00010 [Candidatus Methanospirareceae archaeon]
MDKKILKGLLILLVSVVIAVSAVFVFIVDKHTEYFTGILYGAAGVGLFMLLAKILSLIQKEGKQDD